MRAVRYSLVVALLTVSVMPVPVVAQTTGRVWRVGVLSPFIGPDSMFFETLRQRLQQLGYVEGRNVAFVYRAAEDFDRLQSYAAELVRLQVDVIVTAGPQGVRAARGATSQIPIVMGNVGDAVDQGFVASLAKPGGNVTGLSSLNTELSAKRLALLKELLPKASQIAVVREAVGDAAPLRATQDAARSLGITLQIFQVRDADELPSAFVAAASARMHAIEVLSGPMFASQMRRIVELVATTRLPAIYPDDRFVEAGGLVSYGSRITDLYARAAEYVDRILRGAKPGELAVEQPTTFVLALNVRTAKKLGLHVPPAVLVRADRVIE
jgi:ABC-type uncharacterized transport system substrate-binding protein